MDKACTNLKALLNSPPPTMLTNYFQAKFLHTFKFPNPNSDSLFINGGHQGHYFFLLNVNFFNIKGMHIRGASTSAGIISLAYLNLPLNIWYNLENIYVAIIPCPWEPHLTKLNNYLLPIIDEMASSWEWGMCLSKMPSCPNGHTTHNAIAAMVCNLPDRYKVA
jgi:hypothetical protein